MAPHAAQRTPVGAACAGTPGLQQGLAMAVPNAGSANPATPCLAPSTSLPASWPPPPSPIALPSPIILPAPTAGLTATFLAVTAAPPAMFPKMAALLPSPFLPTSVAAPSAYAAATAVALPVTSAAALTVAPVLPRPMPSRTLELSKLHQARQRQLFRMAGVLDSAMRQHVVSGTALAAQGPPRRDARPDAADTAKAAQSAATATEQQRQRQRRRQVEHPGHDVSPTSRQQSGLQLARIVPHYDPWEEDVQPAPLESSALTAADDAGPPKPGHHLPHAQRPGQHPSTADSQRNPLTAEVLPQPSQLPTGACSPGGPARQPAQHRAQVATGYDPWAEPVVESGPRAASRSAAPEEWSPILYPVHQQQPEGHEGQDARENDLPPASAAVTASAPPSAAAHPCSHSGPDKAPRERLPIQHGLSGQQPAGALPRYDPWEETSSSARPAAPRSDACVSVQSAAARANHLGPGARRHCRERRAADGPSRRGRSLQPGRA